MMDIHKRSFISALFVWLLVLAVPAQDWVKNFGHRDGDAVLTGLVTDSENFVLVTGTFSSEELEMGDGKVLQSRGVEDVFIARYKPQGELDWAISFGGQKADYVADIALDDRANIYITGKFASSTMYVGDSVVKSSWPQNVYVAKFNSSGEFLWLRKSEGLSDYSWTFGTAVYCQGNSIYFSGFTNGQSLSFGDIHLSDESANTRGFYGKLDSEGNYMSAAFLSGDGESRYMLNDIAADEHGNIYLAGTHTIHTEPDPVTFMEYRDMMYFSKVGTDGTIRWSVEDTALYEGTKISLYNNSLYVLGNREEYRIIFNGGTIDTTSSFYYGIFDTNGNRLMDRKVTGALAYGLYADDDRILVAGGLYLDQLDLDGTRIHRNSDSSSICPIYQDIFFFESDHQGKIGRVSSISGSLEDKPADIWLSERGDLFYTGTFESASLQVEGEEIFNLSELSTFMHVSGTYYDRRPYSFLARREGFVTASRMESPERNPFHIYPNPSSGIIHVKRETGKENAVIHIYDLTGRLLLEQKMAGRQASLDLGALKDGYHVVSLREGEKIFKRPLLIIK